jgi:MFS family permease
MRKILKIDRNVFFLGLTSLLNDISSEIIYPFLPLFLTKVIGVGVTFVGLIEGVADSTSSLIKIFSGYLSDRFKRRKVPTASGYALSALTRPFLAFSTLGFHVLIIRFIDRIGKGIRTAPRDALIAESSSIDTLGRSYGFQRAMDHLGAVLGPLIGFYLLPVLGYNYRLLFLIASIFGFMAFLCVLIFVTEGIISRRAGYSRIRLSIVGFDRNFNFFLLAVLLFALGNSSDAFLLLRAQEMGLAVGFLPLIWMVFNVVRSLTSIPGGIISDKIGRKPTIIIGWAIYGVVYLGFALTSGEHFAWLLFIVYGIYFGLTEGVEKAFVAEISQSERKGMAFGIYSFVVGISSLPASLMFGFIWQLFGSKFAFIFGSFLSILAGLVLTFIVKEKQRR